MQFGTFLMGILCTESFICRTFIIIRKTQIKKMAASKNNKLLFIKSVHTVIWLFFNVVIFYLLYAAITDKIDMWVWACISLVLLEGLVLLTFKMFCPLTIIARKYSDSTKENFDIFLPNWLAKYNKLIYTAIFCIAVIIVVYRLVVD